MPEKRSRKKDAPKLEQPGPEQPTPQKQAEGAAPAKTEAENRAQAEAAPIAGESPPAQAPLELTPQTLAQVINQLSKNQQVFLDELKRLRDEVSSMRGAYSQRTIGPNLHSQMPGADPPEQKTPEIIQTLAPLALGAIQKYLAGPEEKPRSRIAELVEAKLAKRIDDMVEKSLSNVSDLLDAEVEGRVLVQPKKEMPETQ